MTPKILAKKTALFALTKKAADVTIMDLRKVTDMADFFVICSGDSDTQVKAIADAITDGMDQAGVQAWHREGLTERQWVLLDYVDVVVHVFHREARKFYGLEKLWGDAKSEVVVDEPVAPKAKAAKAKPAKVKAVKAKPVKAKAVKAKAVKPKTATSAPARKPRVAKAK